MTLTRRRVLQVAIAGSVPLAGCSGDGSDGGGGGSSDGSGDGSNGGGSDSQSSGSGSTEATVVSMIDTSFKPMRVSVEPGATVKWVNNDGFGHDVTATTFHDSAADWSFSKSLGGGESTSHTFESSGVYEYYCTIHGEGNMCGVVLVGDATLDKSLPCESSRDGGY